MDSGNACCGRRVSQEQAAVLGDLLYFAAELSQNDLIVLTAQVALGQVPTLRVGSACERCRRTLDPDVGRVL